MLCNEYSSVLKVMAVSRKFRNLSKVLVQVAKLLFASWCGILRACVLTILSFALVGLNSLLILAKEILFWQIFIFKIMLYVYGCFAYVPCVCMLEKARGGCLITLDRSYKCLWVSMGVPGIEIWVLWNKSQCSELLSHLSSPRYFSFNWNIIEEIILTARLTIGRPLLCNFSVED